MMSERDPWQQFEPKQQAPNPAEETQQEIAPEEVVADVDATQSPQTPTDTSATASQHSDLWSDSRLTASAWAPPHASVPTVKDDPAQLEPDIPSEPPALDEQFGITRESLDFTREPEAVVETPHEPEAVVETWHQRPLLEPAQPLWGPVGDRTARNGSAIGKAAALVITLGVGWALTFAVAIWVLTLVT